jgi:hypothetical protein
MLLKSTKLSLRQTPDFFKLKQLAKLKMSQMAPTPIQAATGKKPADGMTSK